ncbi:MAG: PAS domain S-box protein [Pyrinomonadaceae bacterium]
MIDILIVDHAAENPRSVRNLLPGAALAGFQLKFATNYREILEGFHSKAYDVCLIDSASGNGLRLFAQARSIGWEAPIILVTTNDAGEAIRAFRNGVADCLTRDSMTLATIERSICCVVEEARVNSLQIKRHRRYLALIDNADQIIYTHDLKGTFTSMNRTGEQLIGYSQEECLSLTVAQIVSPKFLRVAEQMIEHALDSQRQAFYEIEILTKHGQSLAVEVETHLIYHQGKAVEIQSIARDLNVERHTGETLMQDSRLHLRRKSSMQKLMLIA